MGIMDLFKKKTSGNVAKDRLKLVLVSDRANCSSEMMEMMKNDIIEVMEACVNGTLDQVELQFEDNAAVCVVLASDGYMKHRPDPR